MRHVCVGLKFSKIFKIIFMMDEYDLRVSCRTNALFGCKVQKVGK